MSDCLVSVVMPAYNAEKFIKESIDSILNQTYRNFELIIINDGSQDSTDKIVKEYTDSRIRYLLNTRNLGIACTLNTGLGNARGKYIMRLDSDDIASVDRIEIQVEYMENHPDIAVLGCGMRTFGRGFEPYDMIPSCEPDQIKIESLFFCPISHPSVMLRSSLVDEGFLYNPTYERIEDYELWDRIFNKHKIAALSKILVKYRLHPGQVTQKYLNEISDQLMKLRRRQLERLNISPTDKELHIMIDSATSKNEFDVLIAIFKKIIDQNEVKQIYNETLLKQYLYEVFRNRVMKQVPNIRFDTRYLRSMASICKVKKSTLIKDMASLAYHVITD